LRARKPLRGGKGQKEEQAQLPPQLANVLRELKVPTEAEEQIATVMKAFLEQAQFLEWAVTDQRAFEEVGMTPEARFRWLYEFADATPRADRNLAREVECFCQFYGYSGDEMRQKTYERVKPEQRFPFYSIAGDRPMAEIRADAELVQELRQQIKGLWESLKKPGTPFETGAPFLRGLFSQEHEGSIRVFLYGGPTLRELFWINVAELFIAVGQFRFCERVDCRRAFVPSRPRKRFCGELCAGRERIARYRASHAESSDDRHERYLRKVRKKLPKAKPARRPRGKSKGVTK
jgi:hypothetical protein